MPVPSLFCAMEDNLDILTRLAAYLNNTPRAIDKKMVSRIANAASVDNDEAFLALFSATLGLDTVKNPRDKQLERDYLRPGVHRLDPAPYANDDYIKTVGFQSGKIGKWSLEEHAYLPFEPFVCNHPVVCSNFREIPQIGYFDSIFRFPAVLENGIEWMTVTPNEIETMKEPIAQAAGSVLTLGLGLGYYAFHASQKEQVTHLTVVERDPAVISLFETLLLPRFPNKEKIEILPGDAMAFAENGFGGRRFDFVFADLWHDQSDGFDLYLRLKAAEKNLPGAHFAYWIEPTLLSTMRRMIFDAYRSGKLSIKDAELPQLLSDDSLRSLAKNLKKLSK